VTEPVPEPGSDAETRRLSSALQAQLADVKVRIDDASDTMPALGAARNAYLHDKNIAGKVLSSAIAYRLFLFMLPLALTLAGVLGFVSDREPSQPSDVADQLGLSAYVASSVADAAAQAEKGRWFLLVIGVVGLYTASVAAAKTILVVHALIFGVPAPSVPGPKAAGGFLVGATAMIGLSMTMRLVQTERLGRSILVELIALVAIGFLYLAIALVLPHGGSGWATLVPGALLFSGGVVVLRLLTSLYLVHRIKTSSELYGGLGAAACILLWLYFIGRLLVMSAVLNAALAARRATLDG
jgi:uncharacterized BrkB/YihY/UPF0761 family membrane protein